MIPHQNLRTIMSCDRKVVKDNPLPRVHVHEGSETQQRKISLNAWLSLCYYKDLHELRLIQGNLRLHAPFLLYPAISGVPMSIPNLF